MIERLAIIIVGEYRTWPKCSKYTLQGFQNFYKLARRIDWYFVTWNESGENIITNSDIVSFFDSQNVLIDHKIENVNSFDQTFLVKDNSNRQHNYYRKAHLSKIGAQLKQNTEDKNQFIYDEVIEIRPDVFYKIDKHHCRPEKVFTKENEFWSAKQHTYTEQGELAVSDTYQRTTSKTHNIISERINYLDFSNPHTTLGRFLIINGIVPKQNNDLSMVVPIRYTHLELNDLNSVTAEEFERLEKLADPHDVLRMVSPISN
jgi:hypothetical protein